MLFNMYTSKQSNTNKSRNIYNKNVQLSLVTLHICKVSFDCHFKLVDFLSDTGRIFFSFVRLYV